MTQTSSALRTRTMSSTVKCLKALEIISEEPFAWSISEVAASLNQPNSTTHRLLTTLVEAGFVTQDAISRRYSVTGKALRIGTGFVRHLPVYRAAFSVMHEAGKRVDGVMHLAVWEADTLLFLRSYGRPSKYYPYADTGDRRPIHANAMGKAMMAWMPPAVVARVMSANCERYTKKTITSLRAMKKDLRAVCARGYAINDEEWCIGLRAVAAPVFDHDGDVVASISIGAPTHVMTDNVLRNYAQIACEATMKISSSLGYQR